MHTLAWTSISGDGMCVECYASEAAKSEALSEAARLGVTPACAYCGAGLVVCGFYEANDEDDDDDEEDYESEDWDEYDRERALSGYLSGGHDWEWEWEWEEYEEL